MAFSVNKSIIVGKLGKDPEIRNTSGGLKIVNLSVATSDSWIDKASGERKEQTEWHRVVIINDRLATVAEKYLKKGSQVYIEGKIQTRKWTDQSGHDKFSTEILLGKFGGEMVVLDSKPIPAAAASKPAATGNYDHGADIDDEIPF